MAHQQFDATLQRLAVCRQLGQVIIITFSGYCQQGRSISSRPLDPIFGHRPAHQLTEHLKMILSVEKIERRKVSLT
jgi:hypothetical protein